MAEVGITEGFLESLTLDDIEYLEDAVDAPIDDVLAGKVAVKKAKLFRAIAFILARKNDPAVTEADVGKMSMTKVMALVDGVADPVPPTAAAG